MQETYMYTMFFKKRPANALLLSIILVALFLFLAFGVTNLIIQSSLRLTSVDASQRSFYAAESGVELALFSLKIHLPGYEEEGTEELDPRTGFSYSIKARVQTIEAAVLPNQTVTLALFKDIGPRSTVTVQDMSSADSFVFRPLPSEGSTACFRWAILGFAEKEGQLVTESMGDYACPFASTEINSLVTTGKFKDTEGTFTESYTIRDFLTNHHQSYLTVTNLSPQNNNLPFSVTFQGEALADQQFTINSSGKFQNFTQTERVSVPQSQLLPIFYFAIFSSR